MLTQLFEKAFMLALETNPVAAGAMAICIAEAIVIKVVWKYLQGIIIKRETVIAAKEAEIKELNAEIREMNEDIRNNDKENVRVLDGLKVKLETQNPLPFLERELPPLNNGVRAIADKVGLKPHETGM